MDYLTCPGYNPPKASIRIIASSSSRLCGCCARQCVILFHNRDPLSSSKPPSTRHGTPFLPLRNPVTQPHTCHDVKPQHVYYTFFYQPSRRRPFPFLRHRGFSTVGFSSRIVVVIDGKQAWLSRRVISVDGWMGNRQVNGLFMDENRLVVSVIVRC